MPIVSFGEADGWVPAFAGTTEEGFTGSALREAEDALADDAALDLARAAGNRVLPRAQDAVRPARRIGHCLRRGLQGRVGAEQGRRKIGNARRQFGPEQFEDRAFRPGRLAAQPSGQPAQPRHLQCLGVDRELRQLLADVAFAKGRLLPVWELLRQFKEARDLRGVIAPAGARLGITLTPDLVAAEDLWQIPLLLRLGAPMNEGGAEKAHADRAG